jgi:hypothetical protein
VAGLGMVVAVLVILPILCGIVAGLFFLTVPRLRLLASGMGDETLWRSRWASVYKGCRIRDG